MDGSIQPDDAEAVRRTQRQTQRVDRLKTVMSKCRGLGQSPNFFNDFWWIPWLWMAWMAWGGTILSMNFGFDDFDDSDGGENDGQKPIGCYWCQGICISSFVL